MGNHPRDRGVNKIGVQVGKTGWAEGSIMNSFEIQIFRDGAWKTDSIYDDRELAEIEAHRMEASTRIGSLRIVEESYDLKTKTMSLRTIYRDRQFQEQITQKTKSSLQQKQDIAMKEIHRANAMTAGPPGAGVGVNIFSLIVKLGLIGVSGIGGILALKYLSEII